MDQHDGFGHWSLLSPAFLVGSIDWRDDQSHADNAIFVDGVRAVDCIKAEDD
jgi:hypothetical protein